VAPVPRPVQAARVQRLWLDHALKAGFRQVGKHQGYFGLVGPGLTEGVDQSRLTVTIVLLMTEEQEPISKAALEAVVPEESGQRLAELVQEALHNARAEVARRLQVAELPLSVKIRRTLIEPSEGTGWQSRQEEIQVGTIHLDQIFYGIADTSVPNRLLGLRDQLQPLADYLDDITDLGSRPWPTGLGGEGAEGVLSRFLVPMAHYYLLALKDLGEDNPTLIERMSDELQQLIRQKDIYRRWQIAIDGLAVPETYKHRDVSLRPLTPTERGVLAESQLMDRRDQGVPGSDFEPPARFTIAVPSTLLEITTKRTPAQQWDSSSLPNRIVLALFLSDFEIGGTGVITGFELPRWAAFGVSHGPFPLAERTISELKPISQGDFEAIVNLAYKIPEFGGTEGNSREIALYRLLRACGMHWHESGFLDFAIALEAALLGSTQTELAYRFSLYGALFLKDRFEPRDTMRRLKQIYTLRSNLVHGGRVKPPELHAATLDAAALAKAIIRQAVESGWPDPKALDAAALVGGRS